MWPIATSSKPICPRLNLKNSSRRQTANLSLAAWLPNSTDKTSFANPQDLHNARESYVYNNKILWFRLTKQPRWDTEHQKKETSYYWK